MRVGSLFSGIGGFDYAARLTGHSTAWCVEVEPWCQAVLRKHFPGAAIHSDIRGLRGADLEPVDIVMGGFPCQDLSLAGKQAGIHKGVRSGLWFEMLRLVEEMQPRYVLVENVLGLKKYLPVVLEGLHDAGYATAYAVIAAGTKNAPKGTVIRNVNPHVGAPHFRQRYWILAEIGGDTRTLENVVQVSTRALYACTQYVWPRTRVLQLPTATATDMKGSRRSTARTDSWKSNEGTTLTDFVVQEATPPETGKWTSQMVEPWERGVPRMLASKRAQKLCVGRRFRLQSLGNAIVPQIAVNLLDNLRVIEAGGVVEAADFTPGADVLVYPTPTAAAYGTRNNGVKSGHDYSGAASLSTMAVQGSWPTPTLSAHQSYATREAADRETLRAVTPCLAAAVAATVWPTLDTMAVQGSWPTPTARMTSYASAETADREIARCRTTPELPAAVAATVWPTPMSADGIRTADRDRDMTGHGAQSLPTAVAGASREWPTPRAADANSPSAYGSSSQTSRMERNQLDAVVAEAERATGPLNPAWVELLMGYPSGWTEIVDPTEAAEVNKAALAYHEAEKRDRKRKQQQQGE